MPNDRRGPNDRRESRRRRWGRTILILASVLVAGEGLGAAPAAAQAFGAPVTVYVPGSRRNITAPLGVQFAAQPISTLSTAELPLSQAGLLAPILELDQFIPVVKVSFTEQNGFRLFNMSNEFAEGYAWYGDYVNSRMLVYSMDGYSVKNTGGSDMSSWANYFFFRHQLFGGTPPPYIYVEYYLIDQATPQQTRVLVDSQGHLRRFAKILPMASPTPALRERRARARDAAENRVTTAAMRAMLAVVGVVVVGGILNDLGRPIGESLLEDRARCERYRARVGASIVC
jgi:hypothetical protein